MKKGDIVVLMRDSASNGVPDFKRYIGAVGEVVDAGLMMIGRPYVKFGDETDPFKLNTWYYGADQLFKLGSTK